MTASLEFITSAHLATPHGFSTRQGGSSTGYFGQLNLGLSTGDNPELVAQNRQQVLDAFAVSKDQLCVLEQVHGNRVVDGYAGWYQEQADAAITHKPNLLLAIGMADCLPLLFFDPVKHVIGAAHAGWRGTVAGIASELVLKLKATYGSSPADIRVAIGPSIQGACYQVGSEVIAEFQAANFPEQVYAPDPEGRYRLDLAAANRYLLQSVGVELEHIDVIDACTHCDSERFYSHRRDGRKRGSHWAVIKLES